MLIVSAAPFEAEPSLTLLAQQGVRAEHFAIGVGPLNAAKKAEVLKQVCRDRDVYFIGTCGSFTAFAAVELCQVARVAWLPTCVRTGASYLVQGFDPDIDLQHSTDLRAVTAVCSPGVSLTAALPSNLDPAQTVENLELYSVAREIASTACRFTPILAITNMVGKDAHAQWKANFRKAAELTAQYIARRA